MNFFSVRHMKGLLAKRAPLPGNLGIRKNLDTLIAPAGPRSITFTISTGAVDRDQDTVSPKGWKLDAYRSNPVVLWGHNADELPIGRCSSIEVRGNALRATAEFVPAEMPVVGPLAEAVLRMLKDGFLNATSVGFRPLEYQISRDEARSEDMGLDFTSQELMEFSVVSIPSNPEALIDPGQQPVQMRTAADPYSKEAFRTAKDPARMDTVARIQEQVRLTTRLTWAKRIHTPEGQAERRRIETRLIMLAGQ